MSFPHPETFNGSFLSQGKNESPCSAVDTYQIWLLMISDLTSYNLSFVLVYSRHIDLWPPNSLTHTHTHTHTDTSQQVSTITQGENCLVFEQKDDMIWFSLQNNHPGCLLRLNGRWVRQMDGETPGGYWESSRQDLGDSHRNVEYTSEVEPRKSVDAFKKMRKVKNNVQIFHLSNLDDKAGINWSRRR